ncbi:MAG: helix-turn-helix domain-containing protein, partial [Pseudonocardia sp.]
NRHRASPLVKDANLPGVHNGLNGPSDPTSTTSKTVPGEIHTTVRALPYGIAGGTTPEERRGLPRTGAPVSTAEFVEVSVRGSSAEIAAAGQAALAAGRDVDEVARRCGVSRRTVQRWAAAARTQIPARNQDMEVPA